MARRKSKDTGLLEQLSKKGLPFVGMGLVLLLAPIFHGAFRPFGWIFLFVGLFVLALPAMARSLKTASENLERGLEAERLSKLKPPPAGPAQKEYFGRQEPRWGSNSAIQDVPTRTAEPARREVWSPSVFKDIEWRRFEAVCESLFAQAGFTTRAQSHGPDGGVDIWLYSRHAEGAVAVVQCKHWLSQAVGVKELREFLGVMTSNKLRRGTFATSSTYTPDALAFAKDNGINALDGAALIKQIATRTPEQQSLLLAVAYEGEYWRPTCASCGIKLVERGARNKFWGCVNFPRCRTQIWKSSK
jgi:restriction system protein